MQKEMEGGKGRKGEIEGRIGKRVGQMEGGKDGKINIILNL